MPNDTFFDRFLMPAERAKATNDLASLGETAIPLLISLFDGEAKNNFGIPYRQLGMPLSCGLIAAQQLGEMARPLEPLLRNELIAGHAYAAGALGALGTLSEASIQALVQALCSDPLQACEAARALFVCGAINHISVKEAATASATARKALAMVPASV